MPQWVKGLLPQVQGSKIRSPVLLIKVDSASCVYKLSTGQAELGRSWG